MAANRFSHLLPALRIALCAVLLLSGAVLFSQENNNLQFVHRLEWNAIPDVLYYKVVVQKEDTTEWTDFLVLRTEEPFLVLSLKPGHYRYQVSLYDILERETETSSWVPFDVILTLVPEITALTPPEFYLNEDDRTIRIKGAGFMGVSKIRLVNLANGAEILPEKSDIANSGDSAVLSFDTAKLSAGFYDLVIENPGKLEALWHGFRIRKVRLESENFAQNRIFDTSIQEGYSPLASIYGTFNDLLGVPFHPAGLVLRAAIIPIRKNAGFVGVELAGDWHYINAPRGNYIVSAHYLDFHVSLLYQKWFMEKTYALNVRGGGGLCVFTNMVRSRNNLNTSTFANTWIPIVTGGLSFSWVFRKPLYLDFGINYVHIFSVDDMPPGYLRPSITFGVQF